MAGRPAPSDKDLTVGERASRSVILNLTVIDCGKGVAVGEGT